MITKIAVLNRRGRLPSKYAFLHLNPIPKIQEAGFR
jgi:hypothetical protein